MSIRTFTNRKDEYKEPQWQFVVDSDREIRCDHCKTVWTQDINYRFVIKSGDGCKTCHDEMDAVNHRQGTP